jgi:hypothetical protein
MNTLTASSAPQADLPAPTVDGTRDGGLGYDDLKDRNAFTYVVVGPLPIAQPGDGVTVFWAGASVKEHTVTQKDLDSGTFAIAVVNGKIVDAGDGDKAVTYTATYLPGGGVENSLPLTVTVKRSVPGGLDPYPDTPVNENLTAASVSQSRTDRRHRRRHQRAAVAPPSRRRRWSRPSPTRSFSPSPPNRSSRQASALPYR